MVKDNLQEKSNTLSKLQVQDFFKLLVKKAEDYQMDLSTGKV